MTPVMNSEIIKAWADGVPVQYWWEPELKWLDYPAYGREAFTKHSYFVGDPTLEWRIQPDTLMPYFDADINVD